MSLTCRAELLLRDRSSLRVRFYKLGTISINFFQGYNFTICMNKPYIYSVLKPVVVPFGVLNQSMAFNYLLVIWLKFTIHND